MSIDAATQAVDRYTIPATVAANQYTGDTFDPTDLRRIIEADITNQPRSLQKRIGPSEIGIDCDRCLTHKLAGTTEVPQPAAWLPYVGTAMHEQLENVISKHENARLDLGMGWRYMAETRVTVGTIGGTEITGSCDLFDTHTGTVIDWKLVGTTTLRKAKAHGASDQYRAQAMLYGKGWEARGFTVKTVCIYYLPRNAVSLTDAYPWITTYQPALADQALARANRLHDLITTVGADTAINAQPEHTDTGFTCRTWPDYQPIQRARGTKNSADPFG